MAESEASEPAERWLFWPDEPDRPPGPLTSGFGSRSADEQPSTGSSEPVENAKAALERIDHQIRTSQAIMVEAVDRLNRRVDDLAAQVAAMGPEGELRAVRQHVVEVRQQLDDLIGTGAVSLDGSPGVAGLASADAADAVRDEVAAMQARLDAFIERESDRRAEWSRDRKLDADEIEELHRGMRALRIRLKPRPQT